MESAASMNLKVTSAAVSAGVVALELDGEVDVYTAPLLRQEIVDQVEKGTRFLLVHLEKVEYLDSTGLGILIGGVKRLKEQNGAMKLIGPSPRISRIFDITGLNRIFDVYATQAEAMATMGA